MPEVNTQEPLPPVKKRSMGKKPLPVERRRVIVSVRVMPTTREYLASMGYPTIGRALDILVKAVQNGEIAKMIDAKASISIVNLAG